MDFRQLEYFLAIAEEGGITKAAKRLHMAQPPLSRQLKLLEEELGVTLVERSTRAFRLTDAGQRLLLRAKQMLELSGTVVQELKDYDGGVRGLLRVGTLASAGNTLLPARLTAFHRKYPKVTYQIIEGSTKEILELLRSGLVEVGIVRTPIPSDEFDIILMPDEPMAAVTGGEPFWEEGDLSLSLAALAGHPLLMHNRYAEMISVACREAGFEPEILARVDDTRSILLLAEAGMGVAVIQRDWLGLIKSPFLKWRAIDEPSLVTRIAVVSMKGRYISTAARHFLREFGG